MGSPAGDLRVVLVEQPHAVYQRAGDDLRATLDLTLEDILFGFSRTLTRLDGSELTLPSVGPDEALRLAAGGRTFAVPGEGMPRAGGNGRGSLVVEGRILLPRALSQAQRERLAAVRDVLAA